MPIQIPTKSTMGWNSFDCFGRYTYEEDVMKNIDFMAEYLLPYGYDTIVTDIGWYGRFHYDYPGQKYPSERHASDVHLDENGRFVAAEKLYPSGLETVASYAHQKGLKFGVHMMRGVARKAVEQKLPILGTPYTCDQIANQESICEWCHYNYGIDMTKPGAQDYYDSLMALLASWKIDFVKYDDITGFPDEVQAVVKAIEKANHPMILSLSPGGDSATAFMQGYQNAAYLRITEDIWDNQKGIDLAFDRLVEFEPYQKDDLKMDLDMLCIGHLMLCRPMEEYGQGSTNALFGGQGLERMDGFTPAQRRTFMTLRAICASPLMIGSDMPTMGKEAFALFTNSDMIECNQSTTRYHSYEMPNATGILSDAGYLAVFNRENTVQDIVIACAENWKTLTDAWTGASFEVQDQKNMVSLQPNDSMLLKIAYKE